MTELAARAARSVRPRPRPDARAQVVVGDVAAEVGGVVGVDRDVDARVEQPRQRVLRDRGDAAEPDVGQRADRQRRPVGREPPQQRRVLDAADAVVDPLHPEQVDRLPDVVRRAFLPGVRDGVQAEPPGGVEDRGEVARRVADLGRVEPDGEELAGVGGQLIQRLGRVVGTSVAQEARDEPDLRAAGGRAAAGRRPQPADDLGQRDAAGQVHLRVEEHLDPRHPVRPRPGEVGRGEIGEVLRRAQHGHALVVQAEERAQVAERVRAPQRLDVPVRERHAVARGELERELGLERPLDVQVELGLGQGDDLRAGDGHGDGCLSGRVPGIRRAYGIDVTGLTRARERMRVASVRSIKRF